MPHELQTDSELSRRLFAGMAMRGQRFEGYTAERAVFDLIDRLTDRVIELERPIIEGRYPDPAIRSHLSVVK